MKRKILKTSSVLLMILVMVFSVTVPMFALPYNTDISSNYMYDYWGYAVNAPVAYVVENVYDMEALGISGLFQPTDMFYNDGKLYVVDKGGNRILVYDEDFVLLSTISTLYDTDTYKIPALNMSYVNEKGEIIYDTEMSSADKYSLNAPEGIYVTKDGDLYIADTENRRIVVCDMYGNVKNVFQHVNVRFINNFIFRPVKITVDTTGSMQIISKNVNRGLLEIDSDGNFLTFLGTPKIVVSASDWFWRSIASEEQKKNFIKYVPTEYSNITKDARGFIYSTISAIDSDRLQAAAGGGSVSGSTAPVAKLTADGADILKRLGNFPPIGDLIFTDEMSPKIIDCAVDDASGLYTILDQASGRFFTYNQSGEMLFIGGGSSTGQYGRFSSPSSIVCNGDLLYISDYANKTITTYSMTDYAKLVRDALSADSIGEYQTASELWKQVITYNSNLYMAYIGIGKAEMRFASTQTGDEMLAHYQNAIEYFALANEKTNYSKAFTALRTEKLNRYFTLIVVVVIVIVAGLVALYIVKKRKSKKKGAGTR